MTRKLGEQWDTECLNIVLYMPGLIYAPYTETDALIYIMGAAVQKEINPYDDFFFWTTEKNLKLIFLLFCLILEIK